MLSARAKYWTGLAARVTVTLMFTGLVFLFFRLIGMTFWEAAIGALIYVAYTVVTWSREPDDEEHGPRKPWAEIWRDIWDDNRPRVLAIGRIVVGLFAGKIALYFGCEPINAVFVGASVPVLLGLYVTRDWEAP